MNRWKNFIALLLTLVITMTTGMITCADTEKPDSEDSSITTSGEGDGAVSSNASGEGKTEYITISFYVSDTCVKNMKIKKGAAVELWIPEGPSYATFTGWYIVDGKFRSRVTEKNVFNEDTNLIADWDITNWKGVEFKEIDKNIETQRQIASFQQQLQIIDIKIKNITLKKKGNLILKIRSTRMPQSPIELQYSTSKKFTKGKTKTKVIKRAKNTSVKKYKKITLKKLKENKTYYIRARVKSKYNGQTFYSKWSDVQKVKMKKKKKQTKKK